MNIDAHLVRRLVDDQFPQCSEFPIRPIERSGWDNRTFRLGNKLTVRMPSAESYASQVGKEQQWLPFLGEQLSIPIPQVQGLGMPGQGYPWSWSVYGWIEGEDAESATNVDRFGLTYSVAQFIGKLHAVDAKNGSPPGSQNYFRDARLRQYHDDTQSYAGLLANEICADTALKVWTKALETQWESTPVWIHGDLEASNILVSGGKLVAVIDFGNCAVGDLKKHASTYDQTCVSITIDGKGVGLGRYGKPCFGCRNRWNGAMQNSVQQSA